MKALITGVTGFVGEYLAEYLQSQRFDVYGTSSKEVNASAMTNVLYNNLTIEQELSNLLEEIKPDHIYHLAGNSNVKSSWENKTDTFATNVNLTVNLLEAARKSSIANTVKILTVGSSEEYGKIYDSQMPINESVAIQPMNPYGISKATVSFFAKQYYHAYGLYVLHVRPFNHIGPRQRLGFVVPDFSSQIVEMEKKGQEKTINVGNLEAQRDFTDVRDIVRAYYLLLDTSTSFGEIYNVCSGTPISMKTILQKLISLSNQSISLKVDPNKMRPLDVPIYFGDNSKIKKLTGWEPKFRLEDTLLDVLNYFRNL
jgi:GDP-4-dehydro-6-deoxy-D-mannose reductase